MGRKVRKRRPRRPHAWLRALGLVAFVMCVIGAVVVQTQERARILAQGDHFPTLTFENVLNNEERAYLGLGDRTTFSMQDLDPELLVVEFLNKYCYHCQQQAPILNRVYEAVEADSTLRGRVKMVGVGVGNTRFQLEKFREEKGNPFPLVSDFTFEAYEAVGSPKTPFTVLLRRDEEGKRVVASAHRGVIYSDEGFVEEIRAILQYDVGLLTLRRPSEVPIRVREEVTPELSDEELIDTVTSAVESAGGTVQTLKRITLPTSGHVYIGTVEHEGRHLKRFAKVVSRASFCDVCHDIHFIYVFDEVGTVLRFEPIHLTKTGNWEWDENDVAKMRDRLQGRSLSDPFEFDPEVDAVTSATISSHLIFLSLEEGKDLLEELKKEGYIG